MKTNFNDIQNLWQFQKVKGFDLSTMIDRLKQTEKSQKRERLVILFCTPATVGFLFWVMPWRESPAILISLILIALIMIWATWLSYASKLKPVDSTESFDNRTYLTTQIKQLNYRYRIAQRHMYTYGVLLSLALNISYFVLLEPLGLGLRIGIHLAMTLSVLGFMHWSLKKRLKKYDQTLKPTINKLEELLSQK
jgi:ABC-type nickel/cobalt efflux system permease component RcnA